MEVQPLFSVVVPVYEAEKYIGPCIESVLRQSFSDLELVIVDDGSLDSSGSICDAYAAKDGRIRVFHKENGGASSARLFGVQKAEGKWITFLDSDDELTNNALELFINALGRTDAKIIRGAHKYIYEFSGQEVLRSSFTEGEVSFLAFFTRCRGYNICTTLIDRDFFLSLEQPPKELKMGEDHLLINQAVALTNKLYNIPQVVYLYKQNSQSVVSTMGTHYSDYENFRAYIESFDRAIIRNKKIAFVTRELVRRSCIRSLFLFSAQCKTDGDKQFIRKYLNKYLYRNPLQLLLHLCIQIRDRIRKLK